jgi:hypothetical protein
MPLAQVDPARFARSRHGDRLNGDDRSGKNLDGLAMAGLLSCPRRIRPFRRYATTPATTRHLSKVRADLATGNSSGLRCEETLRS